MQSLENITLSLSSLSRPGTSDIERALSACSAAAIADGDLSAIRKTIVLVIARAQCDQGFSKRSLMEWFGMSGDLLSSLRNPALVQESFFAIGNIHGPSDPLLTDPKEAYEVHTCPNTYFSFFF